MNNRLKIGQEVLIHGYVDEIRKDTIIIQNEGDYFGTVECEITNNEMSSTNEVLDKIRAEIEHLPTDYIEILRPHSVVERDVVELGAVMRIINKYKAESEEE